MVFNVFLLKIVIVSISGIAFFMCCSSLGSRSTTLEKTIEGG